ncbi:MAG: serine/threonine-protein kinase [Myxococcota bacterium]
MAHDAPRTLGSFVLERKLGEGGMGVVYAGTQPALERPVALKQLRRERLGSPACVERFEREARAAAMVQHPNVVAVYDCFRYRGSHYIAQELVDGADLRTALEREGPLPAPIAARLALELARGLEEIHSRGLVHRDLKPANVLLGRRGEVKIADFGIVLPPSGAGLTETGTLLGSPPYMAPEQLDGDPADARGDLYALGVLLYEMLTGRLPHALGGADDSVGSVRRSRRSRPLSVRRLAPGTPRALARLVRRCLQVRRRRRVQSATALRHALERILGTPTPRDCRATLGRWLEERGALGDDPRATVALAPRRRVGRFGALRAVAAAIVAACLTTGAVAERPTGELDPPGSVPEAISGAALEGARGAASEEAEGLSDVWTGLIERLAPAPGDTER